MVLVNVDYAELFFFRIIFAGRNCAIGIMQRFSAVLANDSSGKTEAEYA